MKLSYIKLHFKYNITSLPCSLNALALMVNPQCLYRNETKWAICNRGGLISTKSEFQCDSRQCLADINSVCDGNDDCVDGSDELDCFRQSQNGEEVRFRFEF